TSDLSALGSWSTISSDEGKPSGGSPPSISFCISAMRSLVTPSNVTTRASAIAHLLDRLKRTLRLVARIGRVNTPCIVHRMQCTPDPQIGLELDRSLAGAL